MTLAISQLLPDAYLMLVNLKAPFLRYIAYASGCIIWIISLISKGSIFVGAISRVASEKICFEISANITLISPCPWYFIYPPQTCSFIYRYFVCRYRIACHTNWTNKIMIFAIKSQEEIYCNSFVKCIISQYYKSFCTFPHYIHIRVHTHTNWILLCRN